MADATLTTAPVTAELAGWLADVTLDDVPAPVRERAKHLLLDGIGCAFAGAHLEWSLKATDAITRLDGSGPAILIGTGRTTTPSAAALLNSSYVQGFELDDVWALIARTTARHEPAFDERFEDRYNTRLELTLSRAAARRRPCRGDRGDRPRSREPTWPG